jgi:sugar phosphate isomerase/epimerase
MPYKASRREVLWGGAAVAAGTLCHSSTAAVIEPVKRTGASKFKLSCAAYSFRDQLTGKQEPHWTLDDFLAFCADHALDGTELTGYYFPKEVTREYLAQLKRKAFLLGLDISGTAIANDFCHPPGPERDQQIAHVNQWVDHAATLGAPVIRIFSGGVPKGHTEEQARRWCVECIEACCQHAGQKGVLLALENHGGISATAEGLLAIAREVQSPWFGINLDTGNFRSPDPYAEIARAAPYAVTVQVKTEVSPEGSAKQPADLARVVQVLREVGYRGYIALEYEAAEDPNTAVPRYLKQLRNLIG